MFKPDAKLFGNQPRVCRNCLSAYEGTEFDSCPFCLQEESLRIVERVSPDIEEQAARINSTITAHGISCRECLHVQHANVIAPVCSQFTQETASKNDDDKLISIPIFCHIAREVSIMEGYFCGPSGSGFEAPVKKVRFFGTKD